jgi:hypothetical protein
MADEASVTLLSVLRCPSCGASEELEMPTNACVFFHQCTHCGILLKPNPGDCCVFCSFGSEKCPPMQNESSDCCRPALETNPSLDERE